MFLISNSGVICGPLGWGMLRFCSGLLDKMMLRMASALERAKVKRFSVIIIYLVMNKKSAEWVKDHYRRASEFSKLIYNLILIESAQAALWEFLYGFGEIRMEKADTSLPPPFVFVQFYRDMNKAERDTQHERHTVVRGFDLIFRRHKRGGRANQKLWASWRQFSFGTVSGYMYRGTSKTLYVSGLSDPEGTLFAFLFLFFCLLYSYKKPERKQ